MPNPHPSPEAIRRMDGPALAALAFRLGLAPEGTSDDREVDHCDTDHGAPCAWIVDHWELWTPYSDVAQADAVFRQLRTRGWSTGNRWYAFLNTPTGEVYAEKAHSILSVCGVYGGPGQHAEALALLRCAVLAVCSEGG